MSKCIDPLTYEDCDYLVDSIFCSASKEDRKACEEAHIKYLEMLSQCRRVR